MAVKWYGEQVQMKIRRHLAVRLELAARTLRDRIREALGRKRAGTRAERHIRSLEERVRMGDVALARAAAGEAMSNAAARRVAGLGNARAALAAAARAFGVSAPGDYPSMRTGHLRRNVQQETDRERLIARVGTNVLYGKFLEFGTRKMAARPWLSRGLRDNEAELRSILEIEAGNVEAKAE